MAKDKFSTIKITNLSQTAKQGVNSRTGQVFLNPGESSMVEISDAEVAALGRHPLLAVGEDDARTAPSPSGAPQSDSGLQDDLDAVSLERDDLRGQLETAQSERDSYRQLSIDGGALLVGLSTKHKGGGSYSVFSGDEELVTGLTGEQAKEFDQSSEIAQTEFVRKSQKAD